MANNAANTLVSVVVPVYNVAEYLRRCVDSILSQSYTNLDIILVDDGSTDESGKIADEYAQSDDRITVIHKKNGGLSDARNAGTRVAKGRYIFYLDSDDYILSDAIALLLQFAQSNDCDIVQGGFYYLYSDKMLFDKKYGVAGATEAVITKTEALKWLIENVRIKNFAWGKLYKKSLIEKFDFPVGKYFEDSFWQYKVVNECENYGVINRPLTYYRQREGSISGSGISAKILDLIDGNTKRTEFIRTHWPELFPLAIRSLWKSLYDICVTHGRMQGVFREKLDFTIDRFQCEFKRYLPNILQYNLVKGRHERSLKLYQLMQRVYARVTPSQIESIEIK